MPSASADRVGAVLAILIAATACKREEARLTPPPPSTRPEVPPLATLASVEAPASPDETSGNAAVLPSTDWLAFVRETEERREAFLVRPNGRDLRKLPLPRGATGAFPADAHPDGAALVGIAVQDVGDHHSEQLVVWPLGPSKTKEPVVLVGPASGRSRNPVVSPDGKRIAFESGAESFSDLYVVDLGGTNLKRLTRNAEGNFEPVWSADGSSLAFTTSRDGDPEVYRMSADGSAQERLTAFHLEDGAPRWARSGDRIAFLSNREGAHAIFLMKSDGTGQRRVLPALAKSNAFSEPAERDPAWSPDGSKLALVRPGKGGKAAIHLVDVASGEARALTDGTAQDDQPTFSPDGQFLAFVSDRTGSSQIWIMRVDGSRQTRVTTSDASDWRPVWVPRSTGDRAAPL